MYLQERIELLVQLGLYMQSNEEDWLEAKEKAFQQNSWFIPEFIELAVSSIAKEFLSKDKLQSWAREYGLPEREDDPKTIGIVMAGNIPLVGFHDFLSSFISGHRQIIKLSAKDDVLLPHLVSRLAVWNPEVNELVNIRERLNGADAYIATGSNNTSRYFQYYFGKYPNIIRSNRTSVALLTGQETDQELDKLADEVYHYFGRGCRNVTKLYVPEGYSFERILDHFNKYNYLADHNKFRNNYDYQLALLILNKKYYMTNSSILLVEDASIFSPISQLHYEYYSPGNEKILETSRESIQCVVGQGQIPFGKAQQPGLCDYADGVDVLQFLRSLTDKFAVETRKNDR